MTVAEPTQAQVLTLPEMAARDRNRDAVETLFDYTTLPYSRRVSRPDYVFVLVSCVADLERWRSTLREYGVTDARIECDRVPHGLELWTLRTHTPPGKGGYQAALLVHVTAPAGTELPDELADLDTPEAVAS